MHSNLNLSKISHFRVKCIKVSSTHKHFTAITQLSIKLGDTLVMTEELIDTALANQCSNFQPASYAKLQVIILGNPHWNLILCLQEA